MQEERSVANGVEERKPSGPFTCGENEDNSWARGELWSSSCRDRSPSGNLDLRGFEDSNENFVHLVNSVPSLPCEMAGADRSNLAYGYIAKRI